MFKQLLNFFLLIILFTLCGFVLFKIVFPYLQPKTGQLSVNTPLQTSTVLLDGKEIGKTPFSSQTLAVGDHTVTINYDATTWETKITLSSKLTSKIDLNLSKVAKFTSGESLFFRSGQKSLILLSKPEKVKVFLNNEEKGSTPLKLDLEEGQATLLLKKGGYISREITLNIVNDYLLTTNVFLAVDPFPVTRKLDANTKITLFSLYNPFVNLGSSYSGWSEGVKFVQKQFTGTETRFDVLIDPNGKTYILDETEWANKLATKAVSNIGYLSIKENDVLSEKASQQWQKLKIQFN